MKSKSVRYRAVNQVIVALMLVLIAVIVASIFGNMWLHWMQAQASAGKAPVSVTGAWVWALDGGAAVTVYVSNTGDVPVTITSIRLYSPKGLDCTAYVYGVVVNPGEFEPVSATFDFDNSYQCREAPSTGTIDGWDVFVSISYASSAGGGSVGVGTVARAPVG